MFICENTQIKAITGWAYKTRDVVYTLLLSEKQLLRDGQFDF